MGRSLGAVGESWSTLEGGGSHRHEGGFVDLVPEAVVFVEV